MHLNFLWKKKWNENPCMNSILVVELKFRTLRSHRHLPKMSRTQKSALVMETVNKENGCVQCDIVFVSSSVAVWVTFTNTCTRIECLTRFYGASNRQKHQQNWYFGAHKHMNAD